MMIIISITVIITCIMNSIIIISHIRNIRTIIIRTIGTVIASISAQLGRRSSVRDVLEILLRLVAASQRRSSACLRRRPWCV